MHLHLAVPDLIWPDPQQQGAGASCALPALLRLLAKGRMRANESAHLDDWLLQAFGVPGVGIAGYTHHADDSESGLEGAWLRADPCHLRVNRGRLTLADAACFELSGEEANALAERLNAHFGADGLRFEVLQGSRWYLRAEALPQIESTTLERARGRDIDELLPRGPAAAPLYWRRMLNEVQMLLHEHPVNEAREARGELPINSLWLWGEGSSPRPGRQPFKRVRSHNPLAIGLARASGATALALPDNASQTLTQTPSEGIELAVLEQLSAPAAYGDLHAWETRLAALESAWFAPAVEALAAGRIGMLSIHAIGSGASFSVEAVRNDLRHFWRRTRPLRHYMHQS